MIKLSTKIVLSIFIILLLILPSTISSDTNNKEENIKNFYEEIFDESYFSDILITDIKGGRNLAITLKNEGDLEYQNIELNTRLTGGIIFPPREKNHEIILLSTQEPFNTEVIKHKIFGLGMVQVSIELNVYGNKKVIGQVKTLVIGPLVMIIDSILNEHNKYDGYTLFTPEVSTNTYLINNAGEIVHSWNGRYIQGMAVYLLENGNMIRADMSEPNTYIPLTLLGGATGHVGIYDPDGNTVWQFKYSNSEHRLHHDIEPLPNGNFLMMAAEYKTENEAIQNGRNPNRIFNRKVFPDSIIEVKPNGTYGYDIVWEWHVWDHLIQDYDPGKQNYGDVSKHPELIDINYGPAGADWNHINSVDYNEELDQILLSVREFNEIWIIDHSTTTEEAAGHTGGRYGKGGDLLYRWGNPEAYKSGDSDDQKLFRQHDARWIKQGFPGAGNILLFNNKNELKDEPNPNLKYYSSVDEIKPPLDNKGHYYKIGSAYGPINPTWRYIAEEPHTFYSYHLSGAQRLPNGNTLICEGAKGRFFEVTNEKGIVWEYINSYGIPNHVSKINLYEKDYSGIKNLLG